MIGIDAPFEYLDRSFTTALGDAITLLSKLIEVGLFFVGEIEKSIRTGPLSRGAMFIDANDGQRRELFLEVL
jgi:hypothetical protein